MMDKEEIKKSLTRGYTLTTDGDILKTDVDMWIDTKTITTGTSLLDCSKPITIGTGTGTSTLNYVLTTNGTDPTFFIKRPQNSFYIQDSNEFKDIKECVPNMVYIFTFNDGTKVKTVCSKEDIFDLEYAFYLALVKKMTNYKFLTLEGIEYTASTLRCYKYYQKIVQKGMKLFYRLQKEK